MNNDLVYEEIYLFMRYKEIINNKIIYNELSKYGNELISKDKLIVFLSNINNYSFSEEDLEKANYNYEDIVNLQLPEELELDKVLGQIFYKNDENINFIVNPFKLNMNINFFKKKYYSDINTINKNLLITSLNNFTLENNCLYLCTAKNIMALNDERNYNNIISTYFPYLASENIFNVSELEKKLIEFKEKKKELLNMNFLKNIENVNLFYNIYFKKTSELKYIEEGIINIEFKITSNFNATLPIDNIFKLFSCSEKIPMIKYNSLFNKEKLYRLYCDKVSTNGKKIPLLNKSLIFKLMKIMGKTKGISFYIKPKRHSDSLNDLIICDFGIDNSILIYFESNSLRSIDEISDIIKDEVNSIINKIRLILQQKNLYFNEFTSFYNKNLKILNLEYKYILEIKKTINLNKIISCVTSIFNVEKENLESGIKMRYKRIDNYSEVDSIESFILDNLNLDEEREGVFNQKDAKELVENLGKNFDLNETEATNKITDVVSAFQVVNTIFKKKQIKIKKNPGFLTTFDLDKLNNNLHITIKNINGIEYLQFINLYLDSLIRITNVFIH